jgi:cytochrome b pre-mRNA-processing protein 3
MRRDPLDANIEKLYGAIVAQGRAPAFYAAYGVPDTAAGRFDMIVLHVHLVVRRLVGEGGEKRTAGQELCERFFSDMDANLRELGVGDLAVPRQMRGVAEAYYGRAKSYDAALRETGDSALAAALARNVFGKPDAVSATAERLARYVRRLRAVLMAQPDGSIVRGEIAFPRPEDA